MDYTKLGSMGELSCKQLVTRGLGAPPNGPIDIWEKICLRAYGYL